MSRCIAERHLLYCEKGGTERRELVVRVLEPELVHPGEVNFAYSAGTARCVAVFDGLPNAITEEFFGADPVQALQLASDVEPILRRLSKKYDFYFPSGEGYFDE